MIKLTEFTSVVDTYKKNFDIRSKRFASKKKKDTAEKIQKRENKIETNKFFNGLKGAAGNLANKIKPGGDILDTVIRFGVFTLLGLIVKNIDKVIIALKTVVEKLKEFAINAKKFFDEKIVPFLKDVYELGKNIFKIFVDVADFVIDMNPFKDFDSEFNIIIRGILGLASRLGELNAPKGKLPGSTTLPSKEPAKTPAKTPTKSLTRQPAKAAVNPVVKTFDRSRSLVGAGVNEDVIKTDRGDIPKSSPLRTDLEKTIAREYKLPEIAKLADDPKMPADVRAAARNILNQRLELQLARTANINDLMPSQRIRGPYSPLESKPTTPTIPKPKELSLYERFLGKGRQVLGSIEKGKGALGDFAKSLQRKVGNSADALKRIGSKKIPGIGLLNIIPMGVRKFLGRSLRLLGLFLLAREVEQDLRNGDVNAAIVKLTAYGLGWLVTSAGLLAGSALGISGVGTVAGVAVLAGSIGAGAGTEALIRKTFLKEEKEKKSDSTPAKVKPKVPRVDPSKQIPNTPPNPNKRADEDNYDSGGNKIKIGDPVGYDISRGLNSSTTYGSQGVMISREVVIAIQPVEVPA